MNNKKELALKLIDDLIVIEKAFDIEYCKLKNIKEEEYNSLCESIIGFHLKTLKELIQEI